MGVSSSQYSSRLVLFFNLFFFYCRDLTKVPWQLLLILVICNGRFVHLKNVRRPHSRPEKHIWSPLSLGSCGCLTLPISSDRTFGTFNYFASFLCLRTRIGIEKHLLTAVMTEPPFYQDSHRNREAPLDRRDDCEQPLLHQDSQRNREAPLDRRDDCEQPPSFCHLLFSVTWDV